mmetsp:Transcript_35202/g.111249  ORF Transcript_35202/g.111249 Transcript_35202/m.111249 type:complete len:262 (+) Transcript_35202:171-956(+)|eukprot:CAMPEP_0182856444 /NCGR_PEP_ID=MMETSP0034_2-20130328/2436_1 /TAXON_ID=156128 /ORGANISM="Nephroselmis pyriformis, Strain CCMP717" /LENGTH=261 /DNA_ID=CAMNT_0024987519 /DNA_START=108 /DNA_END=893 /DNA_ORIENTATION=-
MAAMKWVPLALLGLLLLGAPYNPVTAEDAADEGEGEADELIESSGGGYVHPLTDIPDEADDVETVYVLPDHSSLHIDAGDKVDIILGFRNGGGEDLNITGIMGSINSPHDFSVHVQNFTMQSYGIVVPPGSEATVPYSFVPDKALHPRDFAISATVFYHGAEEDFASTFFNTTVIITEPPSMFFIDFQTICLVVMILGVFASIIYVSKAKLTKYFPSLKKKRAPAKKVETGTSKGNSADWLQGTVYDIDQKVKARKATAKK